MVADPLNLPGAHVAPSAVSGHRDINHLLADVQPFKLEAADGGGNQLVRLGGPITPKSDGATEQMALALDYADEISPLGG